LGKLLTAGSVLALRGALGAGKTQLVKGLALGLGVPADETIVSPTFVLVREYRGRLKLYHIDAYRLSGAAELLALGFDEFVAEPDAVVAIEWADRAAEVLPAQACQVDLVHAGGDARQIQIEWTSERIAELENRLRAAGIISGTGIAARAVDTEDAGPNTIGGLE
jgi:tRNA threonylcarbamoyladenosine biosynthesis protein TsaE